MSLALAAAVLAGAAAAAAAARALLVLVGVGRSLALPAPPWARLPGSAALCGALRASGLPLSPAGYLAVVALAALGAAACVALVLGRPALAPPSALAAAAAPLLYLRGAHRRQAARVAGQLPAVAAALAAALRAGMSLRGALARTAADAPTPAADELRRVVDELALGARMEEALGGLARRVPARDVAVMVAAIEVQRRAGGNLAAALGDLAERLGERARLARELRGLTAQARLTAWLVGALPLAAGALVELVAPGTLSRALLSGPGPALLVVAGGLYAAGAVLVHRIGRVRL